MALIIQIRLAQHNFDAAEKELAATKSWAQDSLLAQLAEVASVLNWLIVGMVDSC